MRDQRKICELKWALLKELQSLPKDEMSKHDERLLRALLWDGEVNAMLAIKAEELDKNVILG